MDETILTELKEIKGLLQAIESNQEQNDNSIIQMLSNIEARLYSIKNNICWIKNGGKYLGDAKGPTGVAGL
ncbi:hypothetical protein [Oceanobacillus kapialis]|uniref:Uncharacterized protein n=1 Tax=Oceanobacillus kapialis TaxID=481353 RepID=A0ABW5PZF1_9BACI